MAEFKEIAAYFDQLHRDIRQLLAVTEKLMGDAGYSSLPSAGNRATWRITSHIDRPEYWRAPFLTRCYVPDGEDGIFSESLLFVVVLETDTLFDFPPVICARVAHPALGERDIYNQVFYAADYFKTLVTSRPAWHHFRQEQGWIVAEPTFKTPISTIQAYVLNLFTLSDQQKVVENIILPLTAGGVLPELLTLPSYSLDEE
jgi:hypothetical protein